MKSAAFLALFMIFQANHLQRLNGNDMFSERDHVWMQQALQLAKRAEALGEVPVGAVLVVDDKIVRRAIHQGN